MRVGSVMSLSQFIKRLGAPRHTVIEMIDSGDIGAMEFRNRLFIPTYDLEFIPPGLIPPGLTE